MKNCNELLLENKEWIAKTFKKIDEKMQVVAVRSRDVIADGVDENHRHVAKDPN